jgi:hypothetical protein
MDASKLKRFSIKSSARRTNRHMSRRKLASLADLRKRANAAEDPISIHIVLLKKLAALRRSLESSNSPHASIINADLDALVYSHNEQLMAEIGELKRRLHAAPAADMDTMMDMFTSFKL